MKKKLTIMFVLVLVLVFSMVLIACEKDNNEPQVPDFVTPTVGATYGQTLADLSLPEGFSWEEPLTTSVGEVGNHIFHVTYTPSDTTAFQTVTGIEVTVTVSKGTARPSTVATLDAVYGQTLANVGLSDLNTQAGTFAWQEPLTTSVGDAGEHVFHLVFTPTDSINYSIVGDIPVTVRVAKANYDMSGVSLNGASVTYDGQVHSLAISGTLPEGVIVRYEGNGKVDAGTYAVRAIFTAGDQNHNAPAELNANLIILKSDVAGITFSGQTFTYDGQEHSLAISGTLPSGVSVNYTNNGKTDANEYEVVAHFTVNGNYNDVPDMHATLRINKANITGIAFEDGTFTYDGQAHNLAISGTLPNGVTVDYTGNGQVNANVYGVTAHVNVGANFNAIDDLQATLTIEKAYLTGLTFPDGKATYDGLVHTHEVVGTIPEGVTVNYSYEWYDGGDWVPVSEILKAGDYSVYAEFDVNANYNPRQAMFAEFEMIQATPDISDLTNELYVIDIAGEDDKFGIGANALPGVAPHRVNGDWAEPIIGYNILLGDYAKRVGDPYTGDIDNNYVDIEDVEFNVMGWTSEAHTVETTYSEQVYLSMLYLEDEDVTLRLIDYRGDIVYSNLLDDMVDDSVHVYVYEGHITNDELFYGENKLVPIAVYQVYECDGFFSVEKVTWHFVNDEGDPQLVSREVKYLISINENTLEMSLFDVGEIVYVYSNEASGRTISFNRIGDSEPYDCALFKFDGIYTRETLPEYGSRIGGWTQNKDDLISTDAYEGPIFEVDDNDDLHIIVGDQLYVFGFWASDGFFGGDIASGEHYIVFSFNMLFDDPDDLMLWIYVFDEEVTLDTDLSIYEPSLYCDIWEVIGIWEAIGDTEPSAIACTYGQFNILKDGSLELDFEECYFTLNWASDVDNEGTYYLLNENVYNCFPFNDENKVENAIYRYNAARNVVELSLYGVTYLFDPTTRDLGSLKRHIGDVTGWIEMGDSFAYYNHYFVISSGFGQQWVFEYMAESIDDVLDRNVEPFLTYLEGSSWKSKDNLVILTYFGEEYGYYTVDKDKKLIQYFGENVYQFVEYEYVSEENHTPIGGMRYDFNDVLGRHVLYIYYFDGELDAYGNPVWDLDESTNMWEYSEIGSFVTAYGYVGYWEAFRTFSVGEDGETLSSLKAPLCILHYGYFYTESEAVNIETHEVIVSYYTNIVMLALANENPCSFMWTFKGKIAEDKILSIAEIFSASEEAMQELGCIGMLDPNGCKWEYDGDFAWLTILNDKGTDEDDVNYGFYYNGKSTELSTIPFDYEVAYALVYADAGCTDFYYAHFVDEKRNAYGWAQGIWTVEEGSHVWTEEPPFEDEGFWWITTEKEGVNYIVEIQNDYAIGAYPFDENGVDYRISPSSIVYKIEVDPDETPESDDEYTMFFIDMYGLAQPTAICGGVKLDDEQIEEAFAGLIINGVWIKDNNYVQFMTRNYLNSLNNNEIITTESDVQIFEIDGDELVSGAEYNGTLRAVIVLNDGEDDFTFAFGTYFDQTFAVAIPGAVTLEQAIASFVPPLPEPVAFLQGSNIFWAEGFGGKFYYLVEKDGIWSVEEVEFEPVWFVREEGDSAVLVKAGDNQFVFYIIPSDNILLNGGLEDFAECEYRSFWGIWYQSPTSPNRIINNEEGYECWLAIVDRESGELEWEPMP